MAQYQKSQCLILALLLTCLMAQTGLIDLQDRSPNMFWHEELKPLSKDFSGWEVITDSILVSPNKRRIAYKMRRGNGLMVVIDGKPGEVYLKIGKLHFSKNSARLYYMARNRGQWELNNNNIGKRKLEEIVSDLVVSNNSLRYAVAYKTPKRIRVQVNFYHGPSFDEVDMNSFKFSSNNEHSAYFARKGNHWYAQINKLTAGPYDQVGHHPTYDAKSKTMAYTAKINGQWRVIQNNQPWDQTQEAANLQFHPKSHQLYAWIKTAGNQWQLHCNNQPVPFATSATPNSLTFGHFASQWAVVLDQKNIIRVMRSGILLPAHGTVQPESLRFDLHDIQLAYVTQTEQGHHLTIDGELQSPCQEIQISDIVIDNRCSRIAYVAKINDKWTVIDQGKPNELVDAIIPGSLMFSPNTKRLVYRAQNGNFKYLYLDHKVIGEFHDLTQPIFDSKSQHLAWAARVGMDWHMYIDGHSNPTKFSNLIGKPEIVLSSTRFAAMIRQDHTVTPTFTSLIIEKMDPGEVIATVNPATIR